MICISNTAAALMINGHATGETAEEKAAAKEACSAITALSQGIVVNLFTSGAVERLAPGAFLLNKEILSTAELRMVDQFFRAMEYVATAYGDHICII